MATYPSELPRGWKWHSALPRGFNPHHDEQLCYQVPIPVPDIRIIPRPRWQEWLAEHTHWYTPGPCKEVHTTVTLHVLTFSSIDQTHFFAAFLVYTYGCKDWYGQLEITQPLVRSLTLHWDKRIQVPVPQPIIDWYDHESWQQKL